MNKPHIHAEIIKAWADGAEIEFLDTASAEPFWREANRPSWSVHTEYRVKPMPKKDQVVYPFTATYKDVYGYTNQVLVRDQLKLTFDGETGKIKSAEVL